jgi:hypothetical protein
MASLKVKAVVEKVPWPRRPKPIFPVRFLELGELFCQSV